MANPQPVRDAGAPLGPSTRPFPLPQYQQSIPTPHLLGHHPFPQNSSAPHGLSDPRQIYRRPQEHYNNFRSRLPPGPSWLGYGSHGAPSYNQIWLPGAPPVQPAGTSPRVTDSPQSGSPGRGLGQPRASSGVPISQHVVTILGQNQVRPPGTAFGHFKPTVGAQSSHDVSRATSLCHTAIGPQAGVFDQGSNAGTGVVGLSVPPAKAAPAPSQIYANAELENPHISDSGFRQQDKGQAVKVIELAISQSKKEKVDLGELLSQIRSIVVQAEETAEQVGRLINVDSSLEESVACPFDSSHRTPPEALFQHYLCCPSNSMPPLDRENLLYSLQYSSARHGSCTTGGSVQGVITSLSKIPEYSRTRAPSVNHDCGIWGGRFYYEGAPAVVQAPKCTLYPPATESFLSPVLKYSTHSTARLEEIVSSESKSSGDNVMHGDCSVLLPSRYFFCTKEINLWECLPSRCSSLVIQAATALVKVRKTVSVNWLLVNSPAHGIVIDSILAGHIVSLAEACFQEVAREAFALIRLEGEKKQYDASSTALKDHDNFVSGETAICDKVQTGSPTDTPTLQAEKPNLSLWRRFCRDVRVYNCEGIFRSMDRLSAQLSSLYGPTESKKLCLEFLKSSLASSGRFLSFLFTNTYFQRKEPENCRLNEVEGRRTIKVTGSAEPHFSENHREAPMEKSSTTLMELGNANAHVLELESAVSAVNQRAVLERYLRTIPSSHRLSKFQVLKECEAAVQVARQERAKRPNYRAVMDYDGLIWHRSQLEEKNKNKTKEEILAEERDYKRRRMSYRGKKLKRTPTQVVHDIIEGHMEEIVATGGIGCFVKQSGHVQRPSVDVKEIGKHSILSTPAVASRLNLQATNSLLVGSTPSSLDVEQGESRERSVSHVSTY